LLTIGTRLGSYEVTGSLGAGAMGDVYRARDSKLKREVALKILPARFAANQNASCGSSARPKRWRRSIIRT
jgi:serine/threonine protein kinase